MSSKKETNDDDGRIENSFDSCGFCGCTISSEQITMWQGENQFHTDCYKVNTTEDMEQKTKGLGLIISSIKIIDSHLDHEESQPSKSLSTISKRK